MDGQGTTWRRNIAENFNRLSRVHQRYRQTTDRQTDRRWQIANINLSSRSLKILQKFYEKLRTKLRKTYDKLTTTLQVSYENVKLSTTAVIRETLCQSLSLVKYFELKLADNQWQFPKNTFENDLHFPKKIWESRILLTYKRLMKILRRT